MNETVVVYYDSGDEVHELQWERFWGFKGFVRSHMWDGTLLLMSETMRSAELQDLSDSLVDVDQSGDYWEIHDAPEFAGYRIPLPDGRMLELRSLRYREESIDLSTMMFDYALWVGHIVTDPTTEESHIAITPKTYLEEFMESAFTPSKDIVEKFLLQWYPKIYIKAWLDEWYQDGD